MENLNILIGSPRSGVKLLSQCFKLLGSQFPDCHLESETINQLLLQDMNQSPNTPALPKGWLESEAADSARSRIKQVLNSQCSAPICHININNPLITELWQQVIAETGIQPKYIFIIRHPFEVALSIRDNIGLDLAQGHILWLAHIRAAFRTFKGMGTETEDSEANTHSSLSTFTLPLATVITFDQLLADPVSTINSALGSFLTSDLWPLTSELLDHVQPRLKNHHASALPESDKKTYNPYADIYNQIRQRHYSSSAQINENQPAQPAGLNQVQPDCEAKFNLVNKLEETSPQGIQPGRIENSSAFSSPGLIDSLLQALSQDSSQLTTCPACPVAQPCDGTGVKQLATSSRRGLTGDNKSQLTHSPTLTAAIYIPSPQKNCEYVKTFPLIADQWQKISIPISKPEALRDKPITIKPLNTNGTAQISAIKLINKATRKAIHSLTTDEDFDKCRISGTALRMPGGNRLLLLVTGSDPEIELPLFEISGDYPLEVEIWIKGGRDQVKAQNIFNSFLYNAFLEGKSTTVETNINYHQGSTKELNTLIEKYQDFSSKDYWNIRYKKGGTSGHGSYGKLAEFKAKILNQFIQQKNIESVIEFGCGDGNQLAMLNISKYIGVDISENIIEKCKNHFNNDSTKNFMTNKQFLNKPQSAQLTLSLDVIFHLVEDTTFAEYMKMLFNSSSKYTIIYACNEDWLSSDAVHVRRRKFTKWIENHLSNWRLSQIIFNEYPHDGRRNSKDSSFSNFYIYELVNV